MLFCWQFCHLFFAFLNEVDEVRADGFRRRKNVAFDGSPVMSTFDKAETDNFFCYL